MQAQRTRSGADRVSESRLPGSHALRLCPAAIGVLVQRIAHMSSSPHHVLGRRLAWARLVLRVPTRRDLPAIATAALLALYVADSSGIPSQLDLPGLFWIVVAGAIGFSVAGSINTLANELVFCPLRARRLRREIRKRPERILPTAVASDAAELVPGHERLRDRMIPRDELYDEIVPGVTRRRHKDVQVLVGDPGSGKTTALLCVAQLLAKIGVVPVLVPLRNADVSDVVDEAKTIFKRNAEAYAPSEMDGETLWRWLHKRRRVAILTDDIDQIGPDGERGFVLRSTLEELAAQKLPVIVTARPAGIPAGVAASAIDLGALHVDSVVEYVRDLARSDPGMRADRTIYSRELEQWVRHGKLTEVPFYLELLGALHAAGRCPELPSPAALQRESGTTGRCRTRADGSWEWNPLWVRFQLLERYYDEMRAGSIRRWLAIEKAERESSLAELGDAALGMLRVTARAAVIKAEQATGRSATEPSRKERLEDFIDIDDRGAVERDGQPRQGGGSQRTGVSAHEVVDTGQRLRILERSDDGRQLQFRHRIMQAYFAGRRLVDRERDLPRVAGDRAASDELVDQRLDDLLDARLDDLLDPHHPEKLTAHMALTFAALRDHEQRLRDETPPDQAAGRARRSMDHTIVDRLVDSATTALRGGSDTAAPSAATAADSRSATVMEVATPSSLLSIAFVDGDGSPQRRAAAAGAIADPLDPATGRDPEQRRDPDAALINLTTAADIAHAIYRDKGNTWDVCKMQGKILERVAGAHGATRWTKLNAIAVLSKLDVEERWKRMWEFARDPDYSVRRAACNELQRNASVAYEKLADDIDRLIMRAAMRCARGQTLEGYGPDDGGDVGLNYEIWREASDEFALKALGWVLPAIVSGMREDVSGDAGEPDTQAQRPAAEAHPAIQALQWLVALAFAGGRAGFEASVAQGFKDDAMRHAADPDRRVSGPGWVASNRELVIGVCLRNAGFWYSRVVLHQAIALYGIAGANHRETHEILARRLDRRHEPHVFARRAGKLARRALERKEIGSDLWAGLIWDDEGQTVSRRATQLDDKAAQLVGDVTLLLNLNEGGVTAQRVQFAETRDLPHCMCASRDREEILGKGCPPSCGWGLCPYTQPAPDEPNAHRTISGAFCRQQQEIARQHGPPRWQRAMRRRGLESFWSEMERRART